MANFITGIISLTLGVVILANVFIVTVKGINSTVGCSGANRTAGLYSHCELTTGEVAMWGLVSLVAIAGMIYGVLNVFGIA